MTARGALEGRIAVVTGSTSGVGRAIADGFLAAGANVVVNGRSSSKLTEADWGENRERVHFIAADLMLGEDCDRLIDETVAHFGGLDILVNNCGSMARTG